MSVLNKFPLTVMSFVLCFGTAAAQDPTSVDIDLRQSTADTNDLEVFIRANGAFFENVLSGLTFTIRWVTTSPATLGTRVNACPAGIGVSPTSQVTNPDVNGDPTGFNYRSYNAFGISLLLDEGCPLPQDTWFLVTTIPVENNVGCTEFQIVNDEFTSSPGNARDFFVSLGGIEKTGVIEPTAVNMGACAPDCLGVPGGTALPGTPCDDGNPDTIDETFTAECTCIGPLGLDHSPITDHLFSIAPDPTNGPLQVRLRSGPHGDLVCRLSDGLGKVLMIRQWPGSNSAQSLSLDLSPFPAGVYLVSIVMDGEEMTRRVEKM